MYSSTFSLTSAPHTDRSQCHVLAVLPPGKSSGTYRTGDGAVLTAGLVYCESTYRTGDGAVLTAGLVYCEKSFP
jgi:hypothetical protein